MSTLCAKMTSTYDLNAGMQSGITLVDRNGNWPGTFVGTPQFSQSGPYEQWSLDFNGSTWVDLGVLTFGQPISIAFWALWRRNSGAWQRFFDFAWGSPGKVCCRLTAQTTRTTHR